MDLLRVPDEQAWSSMTHGACVQGHQPWRRIVEDRQVPMGWRARAYHVLLAADLQEAPFALDRARMPARYASAMPILALHREPEGSVLRYVADLVHDEERRLPGIAMDEEERERVRRCYNMVVRPELIALHIDVQRAYEDFRAWERNGEVVRLNGLCALLRSAAPFMWKQRADRSVRHAIAQQIVDAETPNPLFVAYVDMVRTFLDQPVDDWCWTLPYAPPLLIDQLQFVVRTLRRVVWRPTWQSYTFEHALACMTMVRRKDLAALFVGTTVVDQHGAEVTMDANSLTYLLENLEADWRRMRANMETTRALQASRLVRKMS